MHRFWTLILALLAAAGAGAQQPVAAATQEARTAAVLEQSRNQPERLRAFLAAMPKGGDLHNHLSGAVYAESWIAWAAAAGMCTDAGGQLSVAPCAGGTVKVNPGDDGQRELLIKAWSMSGFTPTPRETGHHHFFATFDRFDPAETGHIGDALAEVAARAARNHEVYLELMETWNGGAVMALGQTITWNGDFSAMRQAVENAGLARVVAGARLAMDDAQARERSDLNCGTPLADPGCAVETRFLYQVLRGQPPAVVYAQLLLGYALAKADPRIVGVNLVQPEDGFTSMRDFDLHMRMLAFLRANDPSVGITLHAGELTQALVPPEGLRNHIRESVEVAGATRVGHGVDVMQEDHPLDLLAEMARKHVLVEICLTSNAGILGVAGAAHPLPAYLRAHVPVALATDDEGVSRSDMNTEYLRAEESFALPYPTLKTMVRASLEHSFLPGTSLWRGADDYRLGAACLDSHSAACAQLLRTSAKAALEWREEEDLAKFEAAVALGKY